VATDAPKPECVDPALGTFATTCCFGDATAAERAAFERHLMECHACRLEVQRLERAIRLLREDSSVTQTLSVQEMSSVLGMSGSLDQPFAGHRRHVLVTSALYALYYAVSVGVEIGYWWDRLGPWALVAAPLAFLWIFASTVGALAVGCRAVRLGRGGFSRAALIMLAATAVLCVAVLPWFPEQPTVQATFQTYPARLGYLKSVFYAWWIAPVFVIWPLAVVTRLQRQLTLGRYQGVLSLLTGDTRALPPRDVRYPPVWALIGYLGVLFVYNWVGTSHLFDHLVPAPDQALFMGLVMLRGGLWLGLPALAIWWYAGSLNEIKRECIAVLSFAGGPLRDTRTASVSTTDMSNLR
jgi:hypothetical protein